MGNAVFLPWPIFIFWAHIYVLKLKCCNLGWLCVTGSSWVERRLWERATSSAFPSHWSCLWRELMGRAEEAVICPLWRAVYGAGGDQSICSSHMIFTSEWWRKMWSVNAVIWLCNATDCSGSGKVTYLLGWHDWPMSADVWRQASFWSAAAQLCPWAVLVPVQKNCDFYLPI